MCPTSSKGSLETHINRCFLEWIQTSYSHICFMLCAVCKVMHGINHLCYGLTTAWASPVENWALLLY